MLVILRVFGPVYVNISAREREGGLSPVGPYPVQLTHLSDKVQLRQYPWQPRLAVNSS